MDEYIVVETDEYLPEYGVFSRYEGVYYKGGARFTTRAAALEYAEMKNRPAAEVAGQVSWGGNAGDAG
jgi:hypothetical protein